MIPSHITTCVFGSFREVGCVTTFIAALTEALKAVRSTQALSSLRAGKVLIVRSKNPRDP